MFTLAQIFVMNTVNIDLSYLKTIAGDDFAFISEMLTMIQFSVPKEISFMSNSYNEGNYMAIASTAHKIKAPLQMINEYLLVDIIHEIETNARDGKSIQSIPDLIEEFNAHFYKVNIRINEVLASFNTLAK